MLDLLTRDPQTVTVIGDYFVSNGTMKEAIESSNIKCKKINMLFWGENDKDIYTKMQLNVERNGPEGEDYPKLLEKVIEETDIILTHFSPIPKKLIEKGKNLKVILTCRGGLEHIDVEAAELRNIPVINVIRNSIPVAEFCVGLAIDLTRNISISHSNLINKKWEKKYYNDDYITTLDRMKVGIVGLGNIGIETAKRFKALGCKLVAYEQFPDYERLKKNGLGNIDLLSLEELFRTSDLISIHLRLTEKNFRMFDKKYFSLMKPSAYFINTSRGGLVNEEDLAKALKNKVILGAALDVFDKEPIPDDSELFHLENIILTPHIGGATVDAIPKSPFLLMDELEKIFNQGLTERIVNYKNIDLDYLNFKE